jgi:putative two-component system response regulator
MKKHTLIGAEILKDSEIELLRVGEAIARTHHEKWDGSGYPAGLRGVEIPLYGRIVAIADVFDAMTSARPYKETFSVEEALDKIREGRGSHFDPDVVDAFFEILDEIRAIKQQYESSELQEAEMLAFRMLLSQYRENTSQSFPAQ